MISIDSEKKKSLVNLLDVHDPTLTHPHTHAFIWRDVIENLSPNIDFLQIRGCQHDNQQTTNRAIHTSECVCVCVFS